MNSDARIYQDLTKILVKKEDIKAAVEQLGRRLTQDYAGKSPVLIGILKGAVVFYSDLIREIDLPVTCDFMAASSYGSGTESAGSVRILKDVEHDVRGRDVILVEDIVDTGNTLYALKQVFADRGASSVKIATLLDKPERRKIKLEADYFCFTIPNEFVVGYGLDFDEKYRNLPDIGVLSPRIYEK